ncbi:uncharacterized protein KIAA0895-like [Notechis scutatus]|uniref:Uncharacterized protein KIAA0895-like n=1 Tax=Notechis scutatus TaxID=8663 RepID=A0A6J1W4R5_9SAUR|nr:uncharacterized protein KIAA0895-like [Notechis scutatus]
MIPEPSESSPYLSSPVRFVNPVFSSATWMFSAALIAPQTRTKPFDVHFVYLLQATGILNAVLQKYGTYESFEASNGGKLLTKCQIWSITRKYMQKEGCSGEVVVQLTEDLLSQAVMMVENSRPTLAINLSGARQNWLEGMLRHEIGQL